MKNAFQLNLEGTATGYRPLHMAPGSNYGM